MIEKNKQGNITKVEFKDVSTATTIAGMRTILIENYKDLTETVAWLVKVVSSDLKRKNKY